MCIESGTNWNLKMNKSGIMCTGAQFQTYKNCHLENLIGGILSNIYIDIYYLQ